MLSLGQLFGGYSVSETDRYCSMPSHHPDQKFMVWDFYDNAGVAYCYEKEHADLVAKALNAQTSVRWDEVKKTWMDGDERAHIKEARELAGL